MSFLSARRKAGLTQAAAADHLGVSAVSVCQWETGKTLPRSALLPKIAALYCCSTDELLSGNDSDSNNPNVAKE